MEHTTGHIPSLGGPPLFAFDLDGTVTAREILPCLAETLGLAGEMADLTRRALSGEIDFVSSFRKRFRMLRSIPVPVVHEIISTIPLDPHIEAFINNRPEDCAIVTGNLDIWLSPLKKRLRCRWFSSHGAFIDNELSLLSVLDKGRAMTELALPGRPIIAVGESVNDVPMFRKATVGIAFAGVHRPVPEIRKLAHHTALDGPSLCAFLEAVA